MSTFLKSDQLQLINGGYLSDKEGVPVYNSQFVAEQKYAHYIVTMANIAKGKNFKTEVGYTLEQLHRDAISALENKQVQFVEIIEVKPGELQTKLKEEALDFIQGHVQNKESAKVNEFMQRFTTLNDFENFGLFFHNDIVKLAKIYTVQEIIDAVKESPIVMSC
jgi:hypothetical protein